MSENGYSLLVSTIGVPWGYRGAVYSIEGSDIPATYTATALTKKYRIKRALIVGLDSVNFPEGQDDQKLIMKRIEELKKAKEGLFQSFLRSFRKASEAESYRDVLMMELSAKEKFLQEKPSDVYSFFLNQEGYRPNVESYEVVRVTIGNIAAKVALAALSALRDVTDKEIRVMLDITHGLNWLPLQAERGLELGLKLASFTYSKDIKLEVFSSQSIRKVTSEPNRPEMGQIVKLSERFFYRDESLREITWNLLNSYGKLKRVPLLAFFLELSAPIAVTKYVNESWDEIEKDFAEPSDELSVAAGSFSGWLRSLTSGMWSRDTGISEQNLNTFIKKAVNTVYPIGEVLLENEISKLKQIHIRNQKLKSQRRLRLCDIIMNEANYVYCKSSCKDQVYSEGFDLRNFMAHAGFDDLAVCVSYESSESGETYSFNYDERMWAKILNESVKYLSMRRKA